MRHASRPVLFASVIALLALAACGQHQVAPVEEQSDLVGKRLLNDDGTYSVRQGDTLYAIAFHYGMDARDIARWNGIRSPYLIRPGQKLHMMAPPGATPAAVASRVETTGLKPPPSPKTAPSGKRPESAVTNQAPKVARSPGSSSTVKKKPAEAKPAPLGTDPKSWRWPTQGRVLRGYVAGNPSRNGVDIAGREGQKIVATAPGEVVYSGNGLIGYGELIIIRHSEDMLSAYAHNRVRLVREGDRVTAGQKVAEMGSNAAGEAILHFEIRVRGKPVNPSQYLPVQ